VLNRQHKGAFLKRLAINLVVLFTYNIKAAFVHGKKITMFTLNVQEAFNTILKKRLLRHITKQGWPLFLL
jgi:hypothetical protein